MTDHLPPIVCGSCSLCCKRTIVPLIPEEDPDPLTYETESVNGRQVLAHKLNGDCVYLGPGGCSIYDRRPILCRAFDCRDWARKFNMKEWKILAKKKPHLVDLAIIRQGKRLLRQATAAL